MSTEHRHSRRALHGISLRHDAGVPQAAVGSVRSIPSIASRRGSTCGTRGPRAGAGRLCCVGGHQEQAVERQQRPRRVGVYGRRQLHVALDGGLRINYLAFRCRRLRCLDM